MRALQHIERIGPYNHVLGCSPVYDLRFADVGDVPFASRFRLEQSLDDIEHFIAKVAAAGVAPLSVGGDHSITYPIMKALGRERPVGMIHIDAHCDTGVAFDHTKFHHAETFRTAVLAGVLAPTRPIHTGLPPTAAYPGELPLPS